MVFLSVINDRMTTVHSKWWTKYGYFPLYLLQFFAVYDTKAINKKQQIPSSCVSYKILNNIKRLFLQIFYFHLLLYSDSCCPTKNQKVSNTLWSETVINSFKMTLHCKRQLFYLFILFIHLFIVKRQKNKIKKRGRIYRFIILTLKKLIRTIIGKHFITNSLKKKIL